MLLCELWGKCRERFWQNSLINRIAGLAYDVTQPLNLLSELLTLAYHTGRPRYAASGNSVLSLIIIKNVLILQNGSNGVHGGK